MVAEHGEKVDFYLVAFNESAATLDEYVAERGFTGMTSTQPVGNMLADLKIVSQSSMIAVDSAGVITFRKGYGGRGDFSAEFTKLVQ